MSKCGKEEVHNLSVSDQYNYSYKEIPNFLKMLSVNTENRRFISLRDENSVDYYTRQNEAALRFLLPPSQSFAITNSVVTSVADGQQFHAARSAATLPAATSSPAAPPLRAKGK